MNPGIITFNRLVSSQAVAASVTLVTIGASGTGNSVFQIGSTSQPLAANAKVHCKLRLVFTLGATGGFRFAATPPATPGNFTGSAAVFDTVTPAVVSNAQNPTSANFANALAVAGTHYIDWDVDYTNGATAGTLAFQFACNTAANAITLLPGSWMMAILGN